MASRVDELFGRLGHGGHISSLYKIHLAHSSATFLIAVGFEKYGSEEESQNDAIKHLFEDAESNPGVKSCSRPLVQAYGRWRFRELARVE